MYNTTHDLQYNFTEVDTYKILGASYWYLNVGRVE